jgi:hypothetical protein
MPQLKSFSEQVSPSLTYPKVKKTESNPQINY